MDSSIPDSQPYGSKISILKSCGSFFVWSFDDFVSLRENYRLIGSLCGSLPTAHHQNSQLSLPLLLMPEEVYLLVSRGFARLLECPKFRQLPTDADRAEYGAMKKHHAEQEKLAVEQMKQQKLSKVEQIAKGRKAKQQKLLSKQGQSSKVSSDAAHVTEAELQAVIDEINAEAYSLPEEAMFVETRTDLPLSQCVDVALDFPVTTAEKIRTIVFCDLWDKGYFITSGFKYGCDFLVYPDDVLRFHASHMAVCVAANNDVSALELSSWLRLATRVKKTFLLCSLDADLKASYISFNWEAVGGRVKTY